MSDKKKNIFRIEKNKNYTTISNYHLDDANLSWKAKGIQTYILSKPDHWKVIIEHLINASTDQERSTRSGINELYDNRYWQKYPVYNDKGIEYWETVVYEVPFEPHERIKSIKKVGEDRVIIYENSETLQPSVLGQNSKEPQSQQNQVLGQNVQVPNVHQQKPPLVNTNSIASTDFINQSVSKGKTDKTDRKPKTVEHSDSELEELKKQQQDQQNLDDLEYVMNNCDNLEYIDQEWKNTIEGAIEELVFCTRFETKNLTVPKHTVRKLLFQLNNDIINDTITKMKKARPFGEKTTKSIHYTATALLRNIREYDADIQLHPNYRAMKAGEQ